MTSIDPVALGRIIDLQSALAAIAPASADGAGDSAASSPGRALFEQVLRDAVDGKSTPTATAAPALPAVTQLPAQTMPVAPAPAVPVAATPASYPHLSGDLDAHPELLGRLEQLAASRGEQWKVTSGLRSDAEQQRLWDNRASNPFPVARPGTSLHRDGHAADVTIGDRPIQDVIPADQLRTAGLNPLAGDAVHVELPAGGTPT
ncbi:MAG: M15 family metallopeptidase [Solirubrobacteraceae bacterium]|nr:M15 family metallopeptidase [Solirubrobacteraceae bacterium]